MIIYDSQVCAIEGELNSTLQWFGYIANVSLQKGGGFRFRFSYPTSKYAQNVLLYGLDNVMKLRPQQVSRERGAGRGGAGRGGAGREGGREVPVQLPHE